MKKIILTLCMLACILSFSACQGASDDAIDVYTYQMVEESTGYFLDFFTALTQDEIDTYFAETYKEDLETDADLVFYNAIGTWNDVKGELGEFVEIIKIAVTQDEAGYSGTARVSFTEREMDFTVSYNKRFTAFTAFKFELQYSAGEKMQKAAMNTVLGMGTVFLVLIFMIFIISGFKHISKFEEKFRKKNNAPIASVPAPLAVPKEQETVLTDTEDLTDDLALVAVITAAIAAAADVPADGLVVRSIRRTGGNKWKKA